MLAFNRRFIYPPSEPKHILVQIHALITQITKAPSYDIRQHIEVQDQLSDLDYIFKFTKIMTLKPDIISKILFRLQITHPSSTKLLALSQRSYAPSKLSKLPLGIPTRQLDYLSAT